MSQQTMAISIESRKSARAPYQDELEDSSPFGLQGLARATLQIMKPECITRLAVNLALRATREQIRDKEYVNNVLSRHPEWQDEYQIVHLIERSLWIQGHSDLVMTMTKNPSQIPDNPPKKIVQALSNAYVLHPAATIWYGVPLFGDKTNEDGLPIPVTAAEVRVEASRRIEAAQQHALRWGWVYRAALAAARTPSNCWHIGLMVRNRVKSAGDRVVDYCKQARHDSRRRARAIYLSDLERCRFGSSDIVIPEHRTWLGRSLETTFLAFELAQLLTSDEAMTSPFFGFAAYSLGIASFAPLIFIPLSVASVDPFLFVELPDEPGKLRHLGHWYWQKQSCGREKLHLHV